MPFVKRHRTYYKYYQNWTQPVLTSNTSYGVLTASAEGYPAWQALDGNTSTNWEVGATTTGWLNWKLPKKIKITGMKIRSRTGNRPILTCRCYTDSSKTVAIGDSITTTAAGQEIVVANIPAEGIITDNIYFDCSSTQDYLGISDVVITAQEQFELNINGFDVYEDWEQPVLTANTTKVKGGNIVVTCNSEYGADWLGYKSMDGTDTTDWATAARVYSGWLKVVFPYKLKISNLNIETRGANTFEVYDAENGNLITSGGAESKNTPIDYPVNDVLTDTLYFKVNGEETVGLKEVKITAQKLVAIGGTIEDVDYYVDSNKLYNLIRPTKGYYKYVTEAFDFVKIGARSSAGWQSVSQGTNYLYGFSNAYEMGQNAGTSLVWTYASAIPATTYTFNITTSGQGNGYFHNPTVTVTYDDGTTEVVYTKAWSGVTLNEDFTFVASKPIKAIKATGTLSHSSVSYVGINLTLTSLTHIGSQRATADDYDFYVDTDKFYAPLRRVRNYYKYAYEDWTQPVLTSNGIMGSSKYACSGNMTSGNAYNAFDGNTGSIAAAYWGTGGRPTIELIFYSRHKINVTSLQIYWISDPAQRNGQFKDIYCYGRNSEDEDWVQVGQYPNGSGLTGRWLTMDCSSNTEYYHYYKFNATQAVGASYNDSNYLGELKYSGTQQVPYLSTEEDYDYYVDKYITY